MGLEDSNPREADTGRGFAKLPPLVWGGGAGYNSNAYLNGYFAFICINVKMIFRKKKI